MVCVVFFLVLSIKVEEIRIYILKGFKILKDYIEIEVRRYFLL